MQAIKQEPTLVRLDEKYESNVQPYQTIIKTISMQNNELYSLQSKYAKLQKEYDHLKQTVKVTQREEQKNQENKRQLKRQRNRFIQEALTVKEKEFDQQYELKRFQRLEEIGLKYQQISMLREERKSFNVFFDINQELLEEVLQDLQEKGQEEHAKEIGSWLALYRTTMKKQQK